MTFQKIEMDVSKKEHGAFKKVGSVAIFAPLLMDILPFINSPVKKDEKGADIVEDGIPVYEAQEANWIQGAMLAMVKAQARNKLKSGTADLKDNNKIAENWDELCAEGVRDGAGLAIAREARQAFIDYISKQGLKENAANTLVALFSNKAALQLQDKSIKDKVKARVLSFGESLSEELVEKYTRPLNAVMEACETEAAEADF